MGFVDALQALQSQLEDNTLLQAFCQAEWGKGLTVKIVYKDRVAIHTDDLPLILITRPKVSRTISTGAKDGKHLVRLYAGFFQADREVGALELISFEEAIEDALDADQTLGGTAGAIDFGDSVNDEGAFHPSYFLTKEITVRHRVWKIS